MNSIWVEELTRDTWVDAGASCSFLWGSSPVLSTDYAHLSHLPYLNLNSISAFFPHSISSSVVFLRRTTAGFHSPTLSDLSGRFYTYISTFDSDSRLSRSTYFVVCLLWNGFWRASRSGFCSQLISNFCLPA